MKFRHHRGGLEDSLKTTIEVKSLEELMVHLDAGWKCYGKAIEEIKFDYVGMDERIGWDTYYVLQRLQGEDQWTVAGMSDGVFEEVTE
jgi:hypothetical protein